ncbi:hypothetical protein EDB83DRAFT_2386112, partial [Lactarius deliciosus]
RVRQHSSSRVLPLERPAPKAFLGDLSWNMILLISSWIVGPLYVCAPSYFLRFRQPYKGPDWTHRRVILNRDRVRAIIRVLPLCSACQHLCRGNRSICMCVLCTHCLTRHRVMLVVSSVQFSLATGHTMPLVQLIRVFTGTVGSLDGPSSYPIEFKIPHHKRADRLSFTVITASLIGDAVLVRISSPHLPVACGQLGACRIWRLWMIWGCNSCVRSHELHFPCRPCYLSPTGTIFLSPMQLEAMVLIGYRFWKSIQWISKASSRRVSTRSRSS